MYCSVYIFYSGFNYCNHSEFKTYSLYNRCNEEKINNKYLFYTCMNLLWLLKRWHWAVGDGPTQDKSIIFVNIKSNLSNSCDSNYKTLIIIFYKQNKIILTIMPNLKFFFFWNFFKFEVEACIVTRVKGYTFVVPKFEANVLDIDPFFFW